LRPAHFIDANRMHRGPRSVGSFELNKVTDKRRTHLSDAFGYLVWQVAPISAFHREIITNQQSRHP
jgi:hypothetical protein